MNIEDLNGRTVSFPSELPGDPTIIFIAYKQKHQADIFDWVNQLNLKEDSGLSWIELPVIGRGGRLMRSVIDNGMRSGIPSEAMRAKTFTIYTSASKFNRALGIVDTDQIYVALVGKDGSVLTLTSGRATEENVSRVLSFLP